jgi:hypothetical protein
MAAPVPEIMDTSSYFLSYNYKIKFFLSYVDMYSFLVLVFGTHAQSLSATFMYTMYFP